MFLQDGEDQFIYNERTGELFQVYPDNVLEKLEVTIEQLSRFRPNLQEMNSNISTYEDILKKLAAGEAVYLVNEFYSTAIKCIPGTTSYMAKAKGGGEYPIHSGTDLVYDTLTDPVEISAEEYERY